MLLEGTNDAILEKRKFENLQKVKTDRSFCHFVSSKIRCKEEYQKCKC